MGVNLSWNKMTSGLQHPPKSECFLSRCHLKRKVCFLDSPAVAEWQGLLLPGQEASFRKECVIYLMYCCTATAASFAFEIFWGGKSKGRSINQAHVLAPRKAREWVSSSTHFSYHCFADQPHLKRSKSLAMLGRECLYALLLFRACHCNRYCNILSPNCLILGRVLHLLTGWIRICPILCQKFL